MYCAFCMYQYLPPRRHCRRRSDQGGRNQAGSVNDRRTEHDGHEQAVCGGGEGRGEEGPVVSGVSYS